jgi:hypothetical protein
VEIRKNPFVLDASQQPLLDVPDMFGDLLMDEALDDVEAGDVNQHRGMLSVLAAKVADGTGEDESGSSLL